MFYDLNGNLIKDSSRGISEIKYNSLNLPSKITFATPGLTAVNKYVYSAVGEKLSTTLQSGESEFTTLYVGSNIYENGSLKRTLVDGGYVEDGQYYYFVTDHLGSTCVVARADGEVVQTNDYYPYGLSLGEGVDSSDQPYKYNGKELDLGRGLNLYDYGARLLAPD